MLSPFNKSRQHHIKRRQHNNKVLSSFYVVLSVNYNVLSSFYNVLSENYKMMSSFYIVLSVNYNLMSVFYVVLSAFIKNAACFLRF